MENRSGYHRNVDVELTPRQRDVLRLIAQGKSNAEIADALGIGYESVKSYVSDVLAKLGVNRREDAAAWWHQEHSLRRRLSRLGASVLVLVPRGVGAVATGAMALAGVAAVTAIVLTRSGGEDAPTTVGAGVPATAGGLATETPWNPIYGYDAGASTGTAAVDKVMAHISASNLDALAAGTFVHSSACSVSALAPSALRCPEGVADGTPVKVVDASYCSGSVLFPLDEVRAVYRPLLEGHPRLWGLREMPTNATKEPGVPPPRYALFVVNNTNPPQSFVLVLSEDGWIYDVLYGCGQRPEEIWRSWETTGSALLSPPSKPKPR